MPFSTFHNFKDSVKNAAGTFSARVFFYLITAMLFLYLLFDIIFINSQQKIIKDFMVKEGKTMTRLLADNIRVAVFSENTNSLFQPVKSLLDQKEVLQVRIMDRKNSILYDSGPKTKQASNNCVAPLERAWKTVYPQLIESQQTHHFDTAACLVFAAPVLIAAENSKERLYFYDDISDHSKQNDLEKIIGFVLISMDKGGLDKSKRQLIVEHAMIFLVFFFLAIIVTYLIVQQALKPITALSKMVKESNIHVEAPDQIGFLQESFSSLVQQLTEAFHTINTLKTDLEAVTRELFKTQEEERNKLAFDLHDDVAQDLSSLQITCQTLVSDNSHVNRKIISKRDHMSYLISKCIKTVRNLSYDLQPPDLKQLGLARTTYQLCQDFATHNDIYLDFKATGFETLSLEYNIAINCYRIIQEALNNIKNHSKADHVEIRLVASYPKIMIRINDNGIGFDMTERTPQALQERRLGLKNIENRASLLNGKLQMKSRVGKGTKILVTLPYIEKEYDKDEEEYINC